VLILVYPHASEPHIVFTRRSETVATHRGQISLPGGARDAEDATLAVTALRETQEELGIPTTEINLLAALDEVQVVASNFVITPYVGTLGYRPLFVPNADEVAEVIEVPVRVLQDPTTFREETWELRGRPRLIQFYEYGPFQIWGATGRVIQEFLASEYVELAATTVGPVPLSEASPA
jgi:8-oxo-dGTP pyrophosphatase MutT (NUDIX family)